MDLADDSYNSWVPDKYKGMHILLVDSDVSSMIHATAMLEAASYKGFFNLELLAVTPIRRQTVALGTIRNRGDELDVVITAYEEQDMGFITFLKRIRTLKDDIPIFVMMPEMEEQKATRARINGANFFLDKPISDYDLKYLWQHVIRTRKIIAQDKAERAVSEQRGKNREIETPLRIIDVGDRLNRPNVDPQLTNKYEHSVRDPKGTSKMVTLGDDPNYYKYELHGKGKHAIDQSQTSNERATEGPGCNRGSSDSGNKRGPEMCQTFMDQIHMPRCGEGNTKDVVNEPNPPQPQRLNVLQSLVDQIQQRSDPVDPKALHAGNVYASQGPNTSTGLQATVAGSPSLMAWMNQAREAYRASMLNQSPLLSRDLTESHGAKDRAFMTDPLHMGGWEVNPGLPSPLSEHGPGPLLSGPTSSNLEAPNFGATRVSSGDLNEAYQLPGSNPSPTINAIPREGTYIQVTQAERNDSLMAELYPILGYGSSTIVADNKPDQHLTGNLLPTELKPYASSSFPSAHVPGANEGMLQISGISNPGTLSTGILQQERTAFDPLSEIFTAPASHTVNTGQQSTNDVDMQVFQGLEDLTDLNNTEPRRFNTAPNTENLEIFDGFDPDELLGQGGATSGDENFGF
ncbi:hypothetical protein Droror1_Dr00022440 [Drosera rotundifolia]